MVLNLSGFNRNFITACGFFVKNAENTFETYPANV
jgi:hypothetical protein